MFKWFEERRALAADLGLLLLRVVTAGFLLRHGLSKLERWDTLLTEFSDPIGVGAGPSFVLAVFAEVVCAVLVICGAFTRLATIPPLVTMLVAAFIVHAADPWARKELPLLFGQAFAAIALLGPGRFSIDARLLGRSKSGQPPSSRVSPAESDERTSP
jgi:putative oxidoreductase